MSSFISESRYLENSELQQLTTLLTDCELGSAILNGKIEAYWLDGFSEEDKNSGSGSPLQRSNLRPRANSSIAQTNHSLKPHSRKRSSSLGDIDEPSSKQIFSCLVSTMNEAFPDYNFDSTKLEQFTEKEVFSCMRTVNSYLAELSESHAGILERLWKAIDEVAVLRKCAVFTYSADSEEELFGSGALWSFNYFFLNFELKRVCYLTCAAQRLDRLVSSHDEDMDDSDVDDNEYRQQLYLARRQEDEANGESSDEESVPEWDGII